MAVEQSDTDRVASAAANAVHGMVHGMIDTCPEIEDAVYVVLVGSFFGVLEAISCGLEDGSPENVKKAALDYLDQWMAQREMQAHAGERKH